MGIIIKYLTDFCSAIHSINTTNPIQPKYSDKVYLNRQMAALLPYYVAFSNFHFL